MNEPRLLAPAGATAFHSPVQVSRLLEAHEHILIAARSVEVAFERWVIDAKRRPLELHVREAMRELARIAAKPARVAG